MSIFIIDILQTPTCIILSIAVLVLVSGFTLKNLHIKYRDFEISTNTKKKKHKK